MEAEARAYIERRKMQLCLAHLRDFTESSLRLREMLAKMAEQKGF